MKKLIQLFLLLSMASLFLLCAKKEAPYVVKVAKQVIPSVVFEKKFRSSPEFRENVIYNIDVLKEFIDDNYIDNLLFEAEGFARGLERDSVVTARLFIEKGRILTRPKGALYAKIVPAEITVTDEEVRADYESSRFEYKIADILFKNKARADSVHALLQKGADFADLARKYSQDGRSRESGGEVPKYLRWGTMGYAADAALRNMEPGEITPPLVTLFGIHIIKVIDKRPWAAPPFEDIHPRIRNQIKAKKLNQLTEAYSISLYDKYNFRVSSGVLPEVFAHYRTEKGVGRLDLAAMPKKLQKARVAEWKGGSWDVRKLASQLATAPSPLLFPWNSVDDVEDFVRKSAVAELMLAEAEALGLDDSPAFKSEYAALRNQIVRTRCREILAPQIRTLTEEEVQAFYEEQRERLGEVSLAEVRPTLEGQLLLNKNRELRKQAAKQLRGKYPIFYNEAELRRIVLSLGSGGDAVAHQKEEADGPNDVE